jgi:hypothetical protein
MNSWIGVDFDGTLAENHGEGTDQVGVPIPGMVERVKQWLARGIEVKIFTARVSHGDFSDKTVRVIDTWCLQHIGQVLPITNEKDWGCIRIYDDRAVAVEFNTGRILGGNDV